MASGITLVSVDHTKPESVTLTINAIAEEVNEVECWLRLRDRIDDQIFIKRIQMYSINEIEDSFDEESPIQ